MEKKATSLELTIISAEELRIDSRPIKKNAFATVGTGEEDNWRSTAVDRDGGSYPRWNEKLELKLRPSDRCITVQVQCKTASGIKMVGRAEVPVSDIVEGYVPADQLHFLSYRLRERDGKRNGIINLCVKMVGPISRSSSVMTWKQESPPSSSSSSSSFLPSHSTYLCEGSVTGMAIGVPVEPKNLRSVQF